MSLFERVIAERYGAATRFKSGEGGHKKPFAKTDDSPMGQRAKRKGGDFTDDKTHRYPHFKNRAAAAAALKQAYARHGAGSDVAKAVATAVCKSWGCKGPKDEPPPGGMCPSEVAGTLCKKPSPKSSYHGGGTHGEGGADPTEPLHRWPCNYGDGSCDFLAKSKKHKETMKKGVEAAKAKKVPPKKGGKPIKSPWKEDLSRRPLNLLGG